MEKQNMIKKWYVIHTYSGYEKKVMTDLEKRIKTLELDDRVFRIIVPEEESVEMRRGKKKVVARKLYSGYVLIEMLVEREEDNEGIGYRVDSDAWYVIRNTNGVTGFVGVGSEPIPMEDDEINSIFKRIGMETIKTSETNEEIEDIPSIDVEVGEFVTLKEGGFAGNEGKVASIDFEHKKVKVMIEMFGRLTPVEVSFSGVEKAL